MLAADEATASGGVFSQAGRRWQFLLDKSSPHIAARWVAFVVCLCVYILRVYVAQGWFIVTYGLGIYLLNLLIGFLSPQFDPEETDIDTGLPMANNEEFRPFARRLPEFKFWYSCIKAVCTSFCMSFFEVFNVPVFWPILLLYFIVLFFITMKRQIRHMIKHKYVPWSWGKTKYAGKAPVKDAK